MKFKLLLLLILTACFAYADEYSDQISKQDSYLKNIRSQIQEQSKQIKSAANEKAKTAAMLEKAQMELEYQNKLLRQINMKYADMKFRQRKLEKKAARLEKERKSLIKAIKSSNKYLASNSGGMALEAVLLSDNAKESEAVSQILTQVNRSMLDSVIRLKENTENIRKNTQELEQRKNEISIAIRSKKSAVKEYESKKHVTSQLYKTAAEDEKIRKAYLASLKKKEQAVQSKISKIKKEFEKTSVASFKGLSTEMGKKRGKLIWPVSGHVIEKFGIKRIEGFKGVIEKKGIKIVPTSSTVKCVYDGVVMHTDNAWGLGNFLIVAHPSGFYSLYANMDGIGVKKNEKVKTGQSLGTIDIDRGENTPYLYFEIRVRNVAVDPLLWLAAS